MPSKRYRLKLEHPYAKAGTIVEEYSCSRKQGGSIIVRFQDDAAREGLTEKRIGIPLSVMDTWLEEVKEEVTYSKEQIQELFELFGSLRSLSPGELERLQAWLTKHTPKE